MLLYEWTREKHNRSIGVADIGPTLGFPAQEYVISTELPDQKFFGIYSFDNGWNNGADQVACRPDTSPETADGTTSKADGAIFTAAQSRDGTTSTADGATFTAAQSRDGTTSTAPQRRDAQSTENLGRSKTWHWWRWFQYSSSSAVHCCYPSICCFWFNVRTVAWLLVKILHICGGQCCTWATPSTSFPHQSNCCCIQTTG